MQIKIYQADAFTDELFRGNPAAVCPLAEELPSELMQKIAIENNLSETAFIFEKNGERHIRWFTPGCEVDLCGHATLASAHVLFNHEGFKGEVIDFQSRSGLLKVSNNNGILELDFPKTELTECAVNPDIENAIGAKILELYKSDDYMAVVATEKEVAELVPDFRAMMKLECRGLIVTAPGENCDFVSRFFAPQVGVDEDPVTGSAHCMLTPYWSGRTGKKVLNAKQISERGGDLICTLDGGRVRIAGKAVTYMQGTVDI